ncbi:hypothetical protein ACH5RR_021958 [Cinchona calisaya]|uniref:Aspartic peptidase DDI1-type domain-containing protein n=1 Tax=Cinchona calisaya TaxID=153742 RepID=A0ABD2Z6F0_9GENT
MQAPKAVADKDVEDFIRLIKKSEYSVVEQLNKMPSQISMLSLLLTSELHREAILKNLSEAHVPRDIPTDKLAGLVGSVLASNQICFSDDDLTSEGSDHNKALFISVRCEGRHLPRVMVDNGSALKICPLKILDKLKISHNLVRNSSMVIRGFDGARRQATGEINLIF